MNFHYLQKQRRPILLGWGYRSVQKNNRWKQGCRKVLEKQFVMLVAMPVVQKRHISALICSADTVVEQRLILCFSMRLAAFEGFGKMSFLLTL